MITYLNGCLAELLPGRLTIDVSGLGYEVLVPLSTSDTMPSIGEKNQILTHFHVRDQEQTLNGFETKEVIPIGNVISKPNLGKMNLDFILKYYKFCTPYYTLGLKK